MASFLPYVILCFLLMYWEIVVLLIWYHLEIFMTPFLWVMFMFMGFWLVHHLYPGLVQFWFVRLSSKMYIAWHAGLLLWNQTRLQWIGSSRPRDHTQRSREPRLRCVHCVTCAFYDEFIDWKPVATIQQVYRIKCCRFPLTKAKSAPFNWFLNVLFIVGPSWFIVCCMQNICDLLEMILISDWYNCFCSLIKRGEIIWRGHITGRNRLLHDTVILCSPFYGL